MFNYYFRGGYGFANYKPVKYYTVVLRQDNQILYCRKYKHFYFAARSTGKIVKKFKLHLADWRSEWIRTTIKTKEGSVIEVTRW